MNNLPNTTPGLAAVSLLASLVAGTILAQAPGGELKPQTKKSELRIMKQGEVLGASITNGQEGDGRVTLGSISDLVLDANTGEVRHAILASGGTLGIGKKQVAIAWNKIGCDPKRGFTLPMTAKELEGLPAFDSEKLHLLGADRIGAEAGTDGNGGGVHDGDGQAGRNRRAENSDVIAAPRTALMLASRVDDCAVIASKDALGAGATLFVEPKLGQVAFLGVSVGGVVGIGDSNYVIPWSAVKLTKPAGDGKPQIQLSKTKKELEAAPKLEDTGADVNDADFRQKVYRFYGVERPAFESMQAARGEAAHRKQ